MKEQATEVTIGSMTIRKVAVTVRELVENYKNTTSENGKITGYNGRLDIRPPFQRAFVYNDKEQEEVIKTIIRGFPLNIMYWVETSPESYELLDGQQRTLSICRFYKNAYTVILNDISHTYESLSDTDKEKFLNYRLDVYVCRGDADDKIEWFKIVNTVNKALTPQEIRNANYTGTWLTDAKRNFSSNNNGLTTGTTRYIKGEADRQEHLETVLKWIVHYEKNLTTPQDSIDKESAVAVAQDIQAYMARHRMDPDAHELVEYYKKVTDWIDSLFEYDKKLMVGLPWGIYYNCYSQRLPKNLTKERCSNDLDLLLKDADIDKKTGVYQYLLEKYCLEAENLAPEDYEYALIALERLLDFRSFSPSEIRQQYEKQNHKCKRCRKVFPLEQMEADHITPWSKGGRTVPENLQLLCKDCNRHKSDK